MPYSPGITYTGADHWFKALTAAGENMQAQDEKWKQDKKLFDSYVTQGEALGLNKDMLKTMSLGEAAGTVEGEKMKRLQAHQAAQDANLAALTDYHRAQAAAYPDQQAASQANLAAMTDYHRQQIASMAQQEAERQRMAEARQNFAQAAGRYAPRRVLQPNPDPSQPAAPPLEIPLDAPGLIGAGLQSGLPARDVEDYATAFDRLSRLAQGGRAVANNEPGVFEKTLPSGKKIEGIYNPHTGNYMTPPEQPSTVAPTIYDEQGNVLGNLVHMGGTHYKQMASPRPPVEGHGAVERNAQLLAVQVAQTRDKLAGLETEIATKGEGHRSGALGWAGVGETLGDQRKALQSQLDSLERQRMELEKSRRTSGRATPPPSPAAPAPQSAPPARRPAEGRIMMLNPEGEMVTAPEASVDELVSKFGYKRIN